MRLLTGCRHARHHATCRSFPSRSAKHCSACAATSHPTSGSTEHRRRLASAGRRSRHHRRRMPRVVPAAGRSCDAQSRHQRLQRRVRHVRRDRAATDVLAECETWSRRWRVGHECLGRPPIGRYRCASANWGVPAAAVDVRADVRTCTTHLRHEIAPGVGRSLPEADGESIAVIIEWLSRCWRRRIRPSRRLHERSDWVLTGPGGGSWQLRPARDGRLQIVVRCASRPATHRRCGRGPARRGRQLALVARARPALAGDVDYVSRFLDAVNSSERSALDALLSSRSAFLKDWSLMSFFIGRGRKNPTSPRCRQWTSVPPSARG